MHVTDDQAHRCEVCNTPYEAAGEAEACADRDYAYAEDRRAGVTE
jgi:hypothetical protein